MYIDVVEELEIAEDCKSLNKEWIRLKLNESDEHALEQAIIIKEKYGATVIAVSIDDPEIDEVLYGAIAKGADKVVKITGVDQESRIPELAKLFTSYIRQETGEPDEQTLILTGTQGSDDLEGEAVYFIGDYLNINCNGVITAVQVDTNTNKVAFNKEFTGGVRGEYEMSLPAVLGIQAAEKPPRYVPIAKIRAAKKSTQIEEIEVPVDKPPSGLSIERMFKPEDTGRAEIIEGDAEKITGKLIQVFNDRGIL